MTAPGAGRSLQVWWEGQRVSGSEGKGCLQNLHLLTSALLSISCPDAPWEQRSRACSRASARVTVSTSVSACSAAWRRGEGSSRPTNMSGDNQCTGCQAGQL